MVEVFSLVDDCCRAGNTTVVVDEDVAHYGENPTLEVGVGNILAFVIKGLQGSILEKIVSVVSVRGEHVGKVKKVALKAHKLVLKFLSSHNYCVLMS